MSEVHVRRVLLADPDPTIRDQAAMALREIARWATVVASTGAEVLRAARLERFDVILLGEPLSDMPSEALVAELRKVESTASIPLVMLLTGSAAEAFERCEQLGVHGHVRKPLKMTKLGDQVREQIGAAPGAGPGVLFRGR